MCTPVTYFTLYTLTGTLFLLFLLTLLFTQPFYIRGITNENIDRVKSSAFGAMMLFGGLSIVSLGWAAWRHSVDRRERRDGGRERRGEEGSLYELIDDGGGEERSL